MFNVRNDNIIFEPIWTNDITKYFAEIPKSRFLVILVEINDKDRSREVHLIVMKKTMWL